MKVAGLIGCAAASLMLAGCVSQLSQGDEDIRGAAPRRAQTPNLMLGGESFEMADCPSGPFEIKHTVTIFLPDHLNFRKKSLFSPGIGRNVIIETGASAPDDLDGDDNNGNTSSRFARTIEPFHILLSKRDALNFEKGYVFVRLLIGEDSSFSFSEQEKIKGVAAGIKGDKSLCGNKFDEPKPYGKKIRQVAVFYINISEFRNATEGSGKSSAVPFNIWVTPDNFPETPIIIDPKVHNEG